jgi:hypothetical protein
MLFKQTMGKKGQSVCILNKDKTAHYRLLTPFFFSVIDELAIEGLSIQGARSTQSPYPPPTQTNPQSTQQHQYQQYQQYRQQQQQQKQSLPSSMPQYQYHGQQQQQYPSMQQQQQHYQQYQQSYQSAPQQYRHQEQPPQQQQFQQQNQQQFQPKQYNQKQEYHQKEEYQEVSERKSTDSGVTTSSLPLTTATMTITANGDQMHSMAFSESQVHQARQKQQQQQHQQQKPDSNTAQKRTSQLPAAVPKVLTPAQQREEEADANIQKAIELHENNQLEEATHYFRLAAQSDNPLGQLMYGLSLRHGWVSF